MAGYVVHAAGGLDSERGNRLTDELLQKYLGTLAPDERFSMTLSWDFNEMTHMTRIK